MVEEILKAKGIKYFTSGKDYVVSCFNPDHEDNNPSMRIDRETGVFHCLSCGYKGDIHTHFNVHRDIISAKVLRVKKKIDSMKYITYGLPDSYDKVLEPFRNISPSTFNKFGAFTAASVLGKDVDGRIVFPIRDMKDNIVGFVARFMYSQLEPRYLVIPTGVTMPFFNTRCEPLHGSIILVEGIFDAINLYDKGLTNAVAMLGANRNKNIVQTLSTFKARGVSKVFIILDPDKAGIKAANEIEKQLTDSFITQIIYLNEDTDPGSLSQQEVDKLKEHMYG